jgi:cytochrome c-type biogenesis protein CcmH/NrfG
VIEINPGDGEAHYQLGRLLASAGKTDEAAREFREALRIEPGFAQAKQSLKQLGAEIE